MAKQTVGHTPGPWEFRRVHSIEDRPATALLLETKAPDQPFNDPCILAVREDWIGWLLGMPRGIANARLIAAAPELLAALEGMIALHADDGTRDDVPEWNIARAAIAKARGDADAHSRALTPEAEEMAKERREA